MSFVFYISTYHINITLTGNRLVPCQNKRVPVCMFMYRQVGTDDTWQESCPWQSVTGLASMHRDSTFIYFRNCIVGVMVSVFTSSVLDRGFDPQSGQTKDYEIGIWCFSAKHAALRRKSKDWLAQNQNNVSEWSNVSIHGLLFQWAPL